LGRGHRGTRTMLDGGAGSGVLGVRLRCTRGRVVRLHSSLASASMRPSSRARVRALPQRSCSRPDARWCSGSCSWRADIRLQHPPPRIPLSVPAIHPCCLGPTRRAQAALGEPASPRAPRLRPPGAETISILSAFSNPPQLVARRCKRRRCSASTAKLRGSAGRRGWLQRWSVWCPPCSPPHPPRGHVSLCCWAVQTLGPCCLRSPICCKLRSC
jgi:hypothetical protein